MPWQIPLSTSTTSTVAVTVNATDNVFVASGVTIATTENSAIAGIGGNHEVDVYGTVLSSSVAPAGISLGSLLNDAGNTVVVGAGGRVEAFGSQDAIACFGHQATITNDGTIISRLGGGIALLGTDGGGTQSKITNTGVIQAETIAIDHTGVATSETLVLVNSGTIEGPASYGASNGDPVAKDLITNTGLMSGDIYLYSGDDLYNGRNGRVDGAVYGWNGNDRLFGGKENNTLLTGGAGDDTLDGGAGKDTLDGGDDTDKLTGGAGADKLTGGTGVDTFIFKIVSDSTFKASGRDTITDFSQSDGDHIDLKAIDADTGAKGNQGFDFIGDDAFSHHAGELRFAKSGGDTIVSGDVNGDGKADFAIKLDSDVTLLGGDFIL